MAGKYDLGLKVGVEGEETFKAALARINANLSSQRAQMRSIGKAYDENDRSVERLTKQQNVLNRQIDTQMQKVLLLQKALNQARDEYGENAAETEKWQEKLNAATEELHSLSNNLEKHNTELEQAKRAASGYADAQEEAARAAEEMERRQKAAAEQVALMSDKLQKGAQAMQTVNRAAMVTAAAIAGVGVASAKVGMDFEAQMSKVEAISGATADEIAALTAKAEEMGATTKFTATESGQALEYMAMAGWKSGQMIDGLPGIMNLAAASGEDLASVSDIVTDALTAFGLQASDSAHFADVLAKASSSSNTNVALLGETFKHAAPVAGALGYSVEDTAVAIGLMANAGIKGEQAGTALRGMLTNLAKPSDQIKGYMDELGISLTDTAGNVKPLNKLLVEMRQKFAKLTDAQKAEYAAGIAGKEAMSGLLAVVNSGDTDFAKLTKAISQSDGTAKRMADTMNKNLKGQLTLLGSAAEGAGIALYDKFAEPAAEAVGNLADKVGEFAEKLSSGELDGKLNALAAAGVTAATAVVGLNAVLMVKDVANFASAVSAGSAALQSYTAATKAGAVAQGALNLVQSLSPMGMLAIAAGAVATGVALYANKTLYARSETAKFDDKVKDLNKRLDDQAKAQKQLADARAESLSGVQTEISTTQGYVNELKKLTDENGRVTEGYEARAAYLAEQINSLIPGAVQANEDEEDSIYKITDAINEQIFAKQKELALEAMQEEYMAALEGRAEAETKFTEAALVRGEAQLKLNELEAQYNELVAAGEQLGQGSDPNAIITLSNGMAVSLATVGQELANVQGQQDVWKMKLDETTPVYQEAKAQLDAINGVLASRDAVLAADDYGQLTSVMTGLNSTVTKFTGDNQSALAQAVYNTQLSYNRMVADAAKSWDSMSETQRAQQAAMLSDMKSKLDAQVAEAQAGGLNIATATGSGYAQGSYLLPQEIEQMLNEGTEKLRAAGVDTIGLGENYTSGYSEGISNNIDEVLSAVESMINQSVDTGASTLDSHSPSQRTMELGQYFSQGMAIGIENGRSGVITAAINVASAAIQAANAKLQIKSPSRIMMKSGMYFDIGFAKGIEDNSDKAEDAASKMSKNVLAAANDWLDEQKFYNRLAVGDEVDFWEQMTHVAELKAGELSEVYKKLYSAREAASKENLEHSRKWIENEKLYNRLSAEEEIAAWKRVVNRKNLLTEEQLEAERELYTVQQQVLDQYTQNLQSRADALGSYAGLFAEITKDSDVSGRKLMQNLKDQVNVFKNWQADMETLAEKGVTGALLEELQQLGPSAAQEIHALSTLSEKELQEYADVFAEKSKLIQEQAEKELGAVPVTLAVEDVDVSKAVSGDGANAIVTVLSTTLVTALASALSSKAASLTGAGAKTVQNVTAGIAAGESALQEKTGQIMQNSADVIAGFEDEMRGIGKNLMEGVAQGVLDGRSGVVNAVRRALEAAAQAARDAMDINSPSKVFAQIGDYMGQGVGVGFVQRMQSVAREIADSIPVPTVESQYSAAERIGEATVNGVTAAMQGAGLSGRVVVEVPVYLDGREITRVVADNLPQIGKQRGVSYG